MLHLADPGMIIADLAKPLPRILPGKDHFQPVRFRLKETDQQVLVEQTGADCIDCFIQEQYIILFIAGDLRDLLQLAVIEVAALRFFFRCKQETEFLLFQSVDKSDPRFQQF